MRPSKKDSPGDLANQLSDPGLQPEQSSSKQKSQHASPSPSPIMGRTGRFRDKFKWGSRLPSPSPGSEHCDTTGQTIAIPASKSLSVSASTTARAQGSGSGTPALQMHGPSQSDPPSLSPSGNVTARGDVTAVSSGGHGSLSSSVQGSPFEPVSAPIIQVSNSRSRPTTSDNCVPPPTRAPHSPEPDVRAAVLPQTPVLGVVQPSPQSSMVWAKALKIAKEKLGDNFPLDLTNLTSQSAEENIEAVIRTLNTLQEHDKKKRWSYTWRGKEVIVVERLGKILKSIERYSKVVDVSIQSNPQVSALVWAGVWAIMQVRMSCLTKTILIP